MTRRMALQACAPGVAGPDGWQLLYSVFACDWACYRVALPSVTSLNQC